MEVLKYLHFFKKIHKFPSLYAICVVYDNFIYKLTKVCFNYVYTYICIIINKNMKHVFIHSCTILDCEQNLSKEELGSPVELISSNRNVTGCQPIVGRWGNEWPSWLETSENDVQWLKRLGNEWPISHPLPLPKWGESVSPLYLPSVVAYEELALTIESIVQQLLEEHNYNTIGNFIE